MIETTADAVFRWSANWRIPKWLRAEKDSPERLYTAEDEFFASLGRGTLVENADEILVDGNGFILRHGNVSRSYTHSQIDEVMEEISDEEVMQWLAENEKRQVADPDYLPYDRRAGF
jgi:hypothetical protein